MLQPVLPHHQMEPSENQGEAKGRQGIDPALKNSGNNQLKRYFH